MPGDSAVGAGPEEGRGVGGARGGGAAGARGGAQGSEVESTLPPSRDLNLPSFIDHTWTALSKMRIPFLPGSVSLSSLRFYQLLVYSGSSHPLVVCRVSAEMTVSPGPLPWSLQVGSSDLPVCYPHTAGFPLAWRFFHFTISARLLLFLPTRL